MTRSSAYRGWLVPLVLALLLGGLALPAVPVGASTLHVTNCGDAGANTLRGQIGAAGVGDTIVFDQNCTITLTTGTLTLAQNITIDGTGHAVVVDGGCTGCDPGGTPSGGVRVFTVTGGTVSLNALTIQHGRVTDPSFPDGSGGGIFNSGTLTVTNSTFAANSATDGGGIYTNGGTLTVTNSTFAANSATDGGGIYTNGGTLTVTNSTLSGNTATNNGGGLFIYFFSTTTLTNCTFSGNSAFSMGGGLSNHGTTTTVTNSTFSGNNAYAFGGIYDGHQGMTVTNTISAGNIVTGGGYPDVNGNILMSGGHNLIGEASHTINWQPSDQVGTGSSPINPRLGTLRYNGGPTQTLALLSGSPAIDAGDDTVCAATGTGNVNSVDQRGVARPQGAHCDIGAFEYQVVNALPGVQPSGPAGGASNPLPAVRPAGPPGGAPNPLPVPRP